MCPYTDKCKKFKIGECDENNCLKLYKIKQLQRLALMTEKQCKHIDLYTDQTNSDKDAFTYLKSKQNSIEDFVSNGDNLFIYSSNCGNGKTSWALRLLNSYIEAIWYKSDITCRALFINVPRFLIMLKDNISERIPEISYIKENSVTADIVVWDDIGTKGFTEYEMENILQIINNRCDSGKANIFTSNLSGGVLKASIGDRLYSRIFNGSEKVKFVGSDKRGLNCDSTTIHK